MDTAFRHLHMPSELACEFLAVFARMEYALKATRFAVGNRREVSASWDRFANVANERFYAESSEDLKVAVEYLWNSPPRKQFLSEGGRVRFRDFEIDPDQSQLHQLILMVRTVRNNLFHGGKHIPDGEVEPGRNQSLVHYSLILLRECTQLVDDVRDAYEL
ncbi:hypothetical protein CWE13_03020 [Aliidiomarina shirensis]|uniref:Uncharacterized protein n=1 Tax=Aliidiomarina shirensis TaxID=1048642 RepID=A0A432WXY1_9GAMM|nr:hypothetical protein [Aliidiomarina shirensis]RUO38632.1 hypothetical protein CWE13_03020 [Aliidiomarina shirensis]